MREHAQAHPQAVTDTETNTKIHTHTRGNMQAWILKLRSLRLRTLAVGASTAPDGWSSIPASKLS